jgi:hypothetical protein
MMTMMHVCRKNGRRIGPGEGPEWARPGEMVKLADEDNWGLSVMHWLCCDSYDVRVSAFGEQEAGVMSSLPVSGLENAWEAYPANLPPKGYPVPKPVPARQAHRLPLKHGG